MSLAPPLSLVDSRETGGAHAVSSAELGSQSEERALSLTIIQPYRGLSGIRDDFRSIWRQRELLYFLIWRSVKVRYKQAVIGVGWVILQPLITIAILTWVFGRLARIPSDGLPYSLFALAGLLPWMLFSQGVTRGTLSVVSDSSLITKVYFPRLLIPIAAIAVPVIDFAVASVILFVLLPFHGVDPSWRLLALPAFIGLALTTALALSLWLAPLNVRYRDVGQTIPFLVQIWMYASPVVYPMTMVPAAWRIVYGLNPMAGVIDGFRWALFGQPLSDPRMVGVNVLTALVALVGGWLYFKRHERNFADVV